MSNKSFWKLYASFSQSVDDIKMNSLPLEIPVQHLNPPAFPPTLDYCLFSRISILQEVNWEICLKIKRSFGGNICNICHLCAVSRWASRHNWYEAGRLKLPQHVKLWRWSIICKWAHESVRVFRFSPVYTIRVFFFLPKKNLSQPSDASRWWSH